MEEQKAFEILKRWTGPEGDEPNTHSEWDAGYDAARHWVKRVLAGHWEEKNLVKRAPAKKIIEAV